MAEDLCVIMWLSVLDLLRLFRQRNTFGECTLLESRAGYQKTLRPSWRVEVSSTDHAIRQTRIDSSESLLLYWDPYLCIIIIYPGGHYIGAFKTGFLTLAGFRFSDDSSHPFSLQQIHSSFIEMLSLSSSRSSRL